MSKQNNVIDDKFVIQNYTIEELSAQWTKSGITQVPFVLALPVVRRGNYKPQIICVDGKQETLYRPQ